MAAAIVVNALMFHMSVENHPKIPILHGAFGEDGYLLQSVLIRQWLAIVHDVNYWPIFRIAADLLSEVPSNEANQLLNVLYQIAENLRGMDAHKMNDLSGRMFQRLITDRKFLATYYTLPVSATLLSELVAERICVNWCDVHEVTSLRVADWACGTGSLIGAMYHAILSRVRKTCDDQTIHSQMLENALLAFDIMPAATHLAASTLASAHPGTPFTRTKVVTMPYGKTEGYTQPQVGSLELLADASINPLFALGRSVLRGDDESDDLVLVGDGSVDVVIMNPPFTRPTNHERLQAGDDIPVPSFAGFSTSADEQKEMANRLRVLLRGLKHSVDKASNGNAGLATNFIDLAHAKLAHGGVLALILPFTFTQGESWGKFRSLLERYYNDVVVISIATTGTTDRAFSADTGMAEVLLVATRRPEGDTRELSVRYVNLNARPTHHVEALMLARQIARRTLDTGSEISTSTLNIGGYAAIRNVNSLSRTMIALGTSKLVLPHGVFADVPIVSLSELGAKGLLSRDISGNQESSVNVSRGPFTYARLSDIDVFPDYPALWWHDARAETRFVVQPDSKCVPKSGRESHADEVWNNVASRLHVTVDFQINSQPLIACITKAKALGGRGWPNFVLRESAWENVCVVWFNSTLGLMSFWWLGTRSQQGRVSVSLSRQPNLLSIDARRLSNRQLVGFEQIFETFSGRDFLPANEAYCDETRKALDEAILVDVLGLHSDLLQELELLRNQWCAEPSVHGGKATQPRIV